MPRVAQGEAGAPPVPPGGTSRAWVASLPGLLTAVLALSGVGLVWAGMEFRHIAFGTPLDATPRPGEPVTPALEHFHRTGENLYARHPDAIAEGKRLYETWCQGCHMPDGSGRIGPSLVGEQRLYARTATDLGLFEAVYGGALGAMQAFAGRLTQDEILKVGAYVQSLRRRTAGTGSP